MLSILADNCLADNVDLRVNCVDIPSPTQIPLVGDTTALYLIKALKKYPNITITKLANGLPIGANLDYADEMTLTRALDGRIKQ